MTATELSPKLVVVTNIPTPYRVAMFNVVAAVFEEKGLELFVIFCALTEPNRSWIIETKEFRFKYVILPGFHPTIGSVYPHINLSVLRCVNRLDPCALIVAGSWNTPTMLMLAFFRRTGLLAFFWSESHRNSGRYRGKISQLVRRIVYRRFDGFCVPNQPALSFVEEVLGHDVISVSLPNTINEKIFHFVPAVGSSSSVAPLKILVVAQMEERKGVLELLEAILFLDLTNQVDCNFTIVGDGALSDALGNIRTSNVGVRHVRKASQEEVADEMRAADCLLLPTKEDPNPLVVVEALAVGLPLLLSQQAGNNKEALEDGVNGCLITTVSSVSIVESIVRFSKMRRVWPTMRLAARKRFDQHFRQERAVAAFLEVMSRGQGGP